MTISCDDFIYQPLNLNILINIEVLGSIPCLSVVYIYTIIE